MPGSTTKKRKLRPETQHARNELRRKGWTQVEAARRFGVSAVHLAYVLNDHRTSARLLRAIAELPDNPNPA